MTTEGDSQPPARREQYELDELGEKSYDTEAEVTRRWVAWMDNGGSTTLAIVEIFGGVVAVLLVLGAILGRIDQSGAFTIAGLYITQPFLAILFGKQKTLDTIKRMLKWPGRSGGTTTENE